MRIFTILLAAFISLPTFAQTDSTEQDYKPKTLTLEDGSEMEFEYLSDDPNKLPWVSVAMHPISFLNTSPKSGAFAFSGSLVIRPTHWLSIEGRYTQLTGEHKEVDAHDTQINYTSLTRTRELMVQSHITLLSSTNKTDREIDIKSESENGQETEYEMNVPFKIKHSLDFDLGYNYITVPYFVADSSYESDPPDGIGFYRYFVTSPEYHNAQAGFSYTRDKSYSFNLDDSKHSRLGHMRVYGFVTYTLESDFEYLQQYVSYWNPHTTETEFEGSPANSYDINKIGWRVGWEQDLYFPNSRFAINLGVEFGQRPHFANTTDYRGREVTDNSKFVLVRVGLRFAALLRK